VVLLGGQHFSITDIPPRSSRRRLFVFCCSFLIACAVSLSYVYSRPAEYRAVARVQISPAGLVAEATDAKSPGLQGDPKSFLTEVQVLTSRPLLQEVVDRINAEGKLPDLGKDPVFAVQRMLRAVPVEGTQVVQLSAESSHQELVADLVNTIAAVYREQIAGAYKDQVANTDANVTDEARNLHAQVLAKQRALDAFRDRYDIVSLDRKENDVLAKIDGLNRTYTESNQLLAKAQGNVEGLKEAAAAGKPVTRPRDDATISAIELQISTLREKLSGLQRRYSATFLSLDPETKDLPAAIAELERQVKEKRADSARAAIVDAEDELASAKITVSRLRKDLDDNQKAAREFAARLAELKGMQEDVDHVQAMERAVQDRATKLQASVRERAPQVGLIEAAAPSLAPWRPNYRQDALISIAGSLFFGLLATWLADFLAGPAAAQPMMVQHSLAMPAIERYPTPVSQLRRLDAPTHAQLPAPEPPPRELDDAEIGALLANASNELRLAIAGLLTGLSPSEIVALSWNEIDLEAGSIAIAGAHARKIRLSEPVASLLKQQHEDGVHKAGTVLHDEQAGPLSVDDLNRLVLYGAYDAGLDRPQDVTSATLRHTYLGFLLRQGIRAADIGRLAGHVPQEDMLAHLQATSPRARLSLEQIDSVHPALRGIVGQA
jgi:succinoglycan biosynthesis transport protein ExoP